MTAWLVLAVGALAAAPVRAQEAIYLVRHAERADSSRDSSLSAEGEARAVRLAEILRGAGITHIYTTDLRRTIQTAMPFAALSHLSPQQAPSADVMTVTGRVASLGPNARALVVGHSNTLLQLIRAFGVKTKVTIDDNEYDNIFIVVPRKDQPAVLLRLKY